MWIAMGGYKAAGDIDRLVKSRDRAMTARAQRGLPITSRIPMSHQVIRDQTTGKAVRLAVNEDKRQLWTDFAGLIMEGIAWYSIEDELYRRFGHVNDKGKKYYPGYMYRLMMKPLFWGHMARNHNNANAKNGYKFGPWIYDEHAKVPEGATVFYNTHDPVWTGDTASQVIAEIRRRSEIVRGHTHPSNTHRFSGLGVCAVCGSFWASHGKKSKNYRGVICPAGKAGARAHRVECDNGRILNEKRLIALTNQYLVQMLERCSTEVFTQPDNSNEQVRQRIHQLNGEIEALELEARGLIRQQAKAGTELESIYQEELTQINTRLKNMKVTRDTLQSKIVVTKKTTELQHATLRELAKLSTEAFWEQESRYINQILHRLMGKKRFLLLDGEIIGVAEVNRRQRSHA
jgi:hypothetical protein